MVQAARSKPASQQKTLLIGYGNDLRGDDAVGRWVARHVRDWSLPEVQVLECQQLTLELAETIAQFEQVIFADASVEVAQLTVAPVRARKHALGSSHHCTPAVLLAAAQFLYAAEPEGLQMSLPVETLSLSETLSAPAAQAVQQALEWLRCELEKACTNLASPSNS